MSNNKQEAISCEHCGGDGIYVTSDSERVECPMCEKGKITKEEAKQELKIGDNTNFGIITAITEYSVCVGKNSKGVDSWYKKSSVKLIPNQEPLEEATEIDLTRLCFYDRRNPDFSIKEEYGYDKEEVESTGNFAKKDCACDNCFYGRSKLTEQLIRQAEIHRVAQEKLTSNWATLREHTRDTAMHIGFTIGFESGILCYEDYYEELDKSEMDEDEFRSKYISEIKKTFNKIYNE